MISSAKKERIVYINAPIHPLDKEVPFKSENYIVIDRDFTKC
jgi:hypothetical protein